MDSIFGDETIPAEGSPEDGHESEAAVDPEGEDEEIEGDGDDQSDGEGADEEEEDAEEGDETDPDAGHSDELLAGKYKSPAELAKAYANAQRKITEQGRELNQLRNQQPGQQAPAPNGGGQSPDRNAVFWDNFKTDPLGTLQFMVQHMASQQVAPLLERDRDNTLGQHFDSVAKQYPAMKTDEGMATFFGKVQEIATELGTPHLAQNPSERIIRMAAAEAFGSSSAKAYEAGKKAGREDAAATRRTKQAVNLPKGGKKKDTENLTLEEQMKADILAAGRGGGGIFG